MAARGDSRTSLATLVFRRLWTALGLPDDDDGRPPADDERSDHDASASPADGGRTFRLLGSGAEDLLDRGEAIDFNGKDDAAKSTAIHDVGHALGLAHTAKSGCSDVEWPEVIMQDIASQYHNEYDFWWPRPDDTSGLNTVYPIAGK